MYKSDEIRMYILDIISRLKKEKKSEGPMETIKTKTGVDGLKAKALSTVDPEWEKELDEGITQLVERLYKKKIDSKVREYIEKCQALEMKGKP